MGSRAAPFLARLQLAPYVQNVVPNEYGRMECAQQRMAKYNATYADHVASDSAILRTLR